MITVDHDFFQHIIAMFETSKEHEVDTEFAYDTFTDVDGETLGIISYHAHRGDSYALFNAAEDRAKDLIGMPHSADAGAMTYRLESYRA